MESATLVSWDMVVQLWRVQATINAEWPRETEVEYGI